MAAILSVLKEHKRGHQHNVALNTNRVHYIDNTIRFIVILDKVAACNSTVRSGRWTDCVTLWSVIITAVYCTV